MTDFIQEKLLKTDNEKYYATAKNILNITPEMLKEKIQRVKDWYNTQPHLPRIDLDDQYLMRHLAFHKFNEEKAKKKIDALFTARTMVPEYFGNRDSWNSQLSKALDSIDLVILPTLIDDVERVIVLKLNIDNREDYDVDMACVCSFMLADVRFYTESSWGDHFVWDCANMSLNQIKQIHLPSVKKLTYVFQNCYSASVRSVHIINAPPIAEMVINVVKAAINKKVSDRIQVHSNIESFHKAFPIKYLSKDMGGDEPQTLKEISAQWGKALKTPEMRQWFIDLDVLKSDESKRLGEKDYLFDDIIGARGTFRQLNLD